MNLASFSSLEQARRLIALESPRQRGAVKGQTGSTEKSGSPVSRVCGKLRVTLTVFAGAGGFKSLLTRALALAQAQERALAVVEVLEDGSLAGLELLHEPQALSTKSSSVRPGTDRAGAILVAHLLDLLNVFIGETLTLKLVRSAWPAALDGAAGKKARNSP